MYKLAQAEKKTRKAKVEAGVFKAQCAKEIAKMYSTLAKIESLKEDYESQCEVASLTNEVETSDNHQNLATEALENANLDNAGLKNQAGFLESQLSYYVKEV